MESILERFGSCPLHRRLALRAAPPHRAPLFGCVVTSIGKSCISFWPRERKVRRSVSPCRLLRIALLLELFGYVWWCVVLDRSSLGGTIPGCAVCRLFGW